MRAVVTGGAGFVGSHLVDALVARGDEVTVVDNLSSGKREYLNPAAHVHRGGHPRRSRPGGRRRRLPSRGAGRRPDVGQAARLRRGRQRRRDGPRRRGCAGAGAQVVFTSTGGAIYGEGDEPATEDAPRRPLSPYGIAKLCAEEYLRGWNRIHGSSTSSRGSGTSTGRARTRGSRAASSRSSSSAWRAASETTIFGDGLPGARLRLRRRRRRGAARRGRARRRCLQRRHGPRDDVLELHRACAEVAGTAPSRVREPARLGDVRRSVLDVSRADARARLARGDAARRRAAPDLGLDACRGGRVAAGVGAGPANSRPRWTPRSSRRTSSSGPGARATIVASTRRGGRARPAARRGRAARREAALACDPAPRRGGAPRAGEATVRAAIRPCRAARRAGAEADARAVELDVLVLNGNGRQGAAAAAASRCTASATGSPATGNARRQDYATTVVMYRAGFRAEAPASRTTSASRSSARSTACSRGAPRRPARRRPRRLTAPSAERISSAACPS